jgi:hypothetical protein
MTSKGISNGFLAPKIVKFVDPRNSSIVAGLVGKKVLRCQTVNKYQMPLITIVANGMSIFSSTGRYCLITETIVDLSLRVM